MFHEVIATCIAGAGSAAAGVHSRQVELVAGNADAAHEVQANLPSQLWLEQGIDVGKDGAVAFVAIVAGPFISPGGLNVETDAILEEAIFGNYVDTNAGIGSAPLGWRQKGL